MKFEFDIQFFGGGSSSEQYRKRDPEDPALTGLRNELLGKIMPGLQAYDPTGWQKANETAAWAQEQQKALLERLPGVLDKQNTMLGQMTGMMGQVPGLVEQAMGIAGQVPGMIGQATGLMERAPGMLDQMSGLAGQIPGMMDRFAGSMDKSEGILDEMLGVVRSGNVPQAMTDRMNQSVTKDLQSGMGSMLNSLGSRGVLNSSITSQGTSRLAQQAAEAYNKNYLNAYNSVVNGYAQGLQGAQGNAANTLGGVNALSSGIGAVGSGLNALSNAAATYLGGANALTNNAGTYLGGANAMTNAAGNFTNAANALSGTLNAISGGANVMGNIPGQAYENATAGLMPAFNMWKTWQTLYNNSEDYDTVVQQGK